MLNVKCKLSHIQFSQSVVSASIAAVSKDSNVVRKVRLNTVLMSGLNLPL